jgi:ribosomal protein L19
MLAHFSRRFIVNRHIKVRSPFDKTSYIENYIPPRLQKNQKQAKWDDPDYHWPPKMEPYTKYSGRALLSELEKEYLQECKSRIEVPEFRTGDLLEVSYFYSLSSKQSVTVTGLCIHRRRRHGISNSFNLIAHESGSTVEMHLKCYSPLMRYIKVVQYGQGNLRARLNYFRDLDLTSYTALSKTTSKRGRVTKISKEEKKKMRLKLLQGEDEIGSL